MSKETLQLHNLDKGIEEKYGNVENFVEEGQENTIEDSIASIEEVETKLKNVREKADKDGRSDEEKKKIQSILEEFHDLGKKIKEGVDTGNRVPLSEIDRYTKLSREIDKKKSWDSEKKTNIQSQQDKVGEIISTVNMRKSVDNFVKDFEEKNLAGGKYTKEYLTADTQDLDPKDIENDLRFLARKSNRESNTALGNKDAIKEAQQDFVNKQKQKQNFQNTDLVKNKFNNKDKKATVMWDGKNIRSANAAQDIPYEKYVDNYDKNRTFPLRSETQEAYTGNNIKKLEIQSQQNSVQGESLEDARIAEELEGNIRGKYRAQANPETFNQQSQTPMESWIEREEQSQNNVSSENNEKGPLARALDQEEILNKGDTVVEKQDMKEMVKPYRSIRDEFTAEQGALSKEMNRQENSWLSKKFSGMRDRVGTLKKSLYEKNPKLGKVLGVAGDKYSQFNRWMNKGNQTQRIFKRIVVSGTLGALTGGVSFGITAARVIGSAAAGAGAGLAHKWYTNKNFDKNLNRNQENLKESYYREVSFKQGNEYTVLNPKTNKTFSIRDRENLTSLRSKREQGTITKGEASQLAMLETTRKSVAEDLLKSRSEYFAYKERLKDKLIQKNERNNQMVSAAAGLVTGLSMRFGPELWDSLTNHPDIPESVPTVTPTPEPVPTPIPEVVPDPIVTEHVVSGDAFINKGEGITHALARQINASPELQAAFGLDGPANGQELAAIARKLGYINEDGSDIRVTMGHGAAYELRIDPKTGEPFVMEYKGGELEEGNYVGGEEVEKHMQGDNFEAKARDSYEYVHDGSPQYAGLDDERVNFSAKEIYPDIDFDKDLNPRIPNTTEIESHGPIGANGEELVQNSQTPTTPESVTENTSTNAEKRILLQQQAAGVEIRHTTHGTELHPIKGFQFTGEIDNGDFSPRELKFLERGIGAKGYQTLVSFDATLPAPFAGTHLIQLKNGQYALEKVSFGGSAGDAQTAGENSMKSIMKAFGMPGDVEHFGPTTMPKTNIYESHAFTPLSDEQAKFIRESYATLNRALTNVPR